MRGSTTLCLLLALVAVAVLDVRAVHHQRKAYARLQALQQQRDDLDGRWSRLLLEYTTLARQDRIAELARTRLGMHEPAPEEILAVRL